MSERAEPEQTCCEPGRGGFHPWVVPVLIVLLGAVAAWGVFAWRSRVIDQETQQRLDVAARDSGRARSRRASTTMPRHLQDIAAFWSVNPEATREDVATYGDEVDLGRTSTGRWTTSASSPTCRPRTIERVRRRPAGAVTPDFAMKPAGRRAAARTRTTRSPPRSRSPTDPLIGADLGLVDEYQMAIERPAPRRAHGRVRAARAAGQPAGANRRRRARACRW